MSTTTVPTEPTEAMLKRGGQEFAMTFQRAQTAENSARDVWQAMIGTGRYDYVSDPDIRPVALARSGWRPISEHDNTADEVLVMADGWTKPIVAWRHHPSSRTDMWLTAPGKYQVKPTLFQPLPEAPSEGVES